MDCAWTTGQPKVIPVLGYCEYAGSLGLSPWRVDWITVAMLSRKCHANHGKQPQFCGKWQQKKEKVVCGNLSQLAESVRLATPLARFGKIVRTASKQRVGSSNLPGRAISFFRAWCEKARVSEGLIF